jgi:transposase
MERRQFTREFKLEAVRLIKERGVSYAQASKDLGVHPTQLRNWVKQLADDPQHAFPGQGQMKPAQLEIAQLKREVAKLKAERDILKNCRGPLPACARDLNSKLAGASRRRRRPSAGHGSIGCLPGKRGRRMGSLICGQTGIPWPTPCGSIELAECGPWSGWVWLNLRGQHAGC